MHPSTSSTLANRVAMLEELLKTLPLAVYTTDEAGKITFSNEAAEELWGRGPGIGRSRFCGSWRLYQSDGTRLPHADSPAALVLREHEPSEAVDLEAERPDGTRVRFSADARPVFDEAGTLIGAVVRQVRSGETSAGQLAMQRLAAIVESSEDAILSKNLDGIIMSWNRGAERLFGYSEQEIIGRPVTLLIPADRQDEEPEILARIRRGERIEHYETVRQRKNGEPIDISLTVSPIVDPDGRIAGASKIARDISDRRRAEDERELLLGEMNHRVKNLFALAGGLLNLSARKAASVPELTAALQERFEALARAHAVTMPDGAHSAEQGTASLHALILGVMQPYLDQETADHRIEVSGTDPAIGRKTVTDFALVFHELATNALKHGALASPEGRIRINCSSQQDTLHLVWRETGVPGELPAPTKDGFGSRLAQATVKGPLGGTFSREFKNGGVEIRLAVPRRRLDA